MLTRVPQTPSHRRRLVRLRRDVMFVDAFSARALQSYATLRNKFKAERRMLLRNKPTKSFDFKDASMLGQARTCPKDRSGPRSLKSTECSFPGAVLEFSLFFCRG
jgi:hypothetical protein